MGSADNEELGEGGKRERERDRKGAAVKCQVKIMCQGRGHDQVYHLPLIDQQE